MAQALEAKPDVEMILGLGTNDPKVPLERTEFVRSDQKYSILIRIVRATQVDTIVHTFLETNSIGVSSRVLHEINVIGPLDRKSTRLNSSHLGNSYALFCLQKTSARIQIALSPPIARATRRDVRRDAGT